jgi:molybdate transport system substrate-binding protein
MRPGPLHEAGRSPARPGRKIGRRRLLQTLPVAAMLAAATPARAAISGTELVLACDITLGPAMRAAGTAYADATGVRVNVFPTELGLMLPQLERDVQNDVVVTRVATLDAAVQAGLVAPGAVRGAWSTRVVLAAKRGAPSQADRPIAISDPLSAADMDGPAILAQLELLPSAVLGVIDTETVVALLLDGTAWAGLLHMTDVRAHPELEVIREVSDDIQQPIAYAAAVTKLARRPDPASLLDFLLTRQATTLLATLGLGIPSSS